MGVHVCVLSRNISIKYSFFTTTLIPSTFLATVVASLATFLSGRSKSSPCAIDLMEIAKEL